MKHYSKLKYPLDRRSLTKEQGLILLAYDICFKTLDKAVTAHLPDLEAQTFIDDLEANLNGLGIYINDVLGADRFED